MDDRSRRRKNLRIVAIIAACHEEDVIAQVVGDLIAQGLEVYLLDRSSGDGIADALTPFLDHGLLAIERFSGDDSRALELLHRKEAIARELDADWLLNANANELRESPWSDRNLSAAIATVDQLGYNAIDFEVFSFPPTRDGFCKDDPLREFFRYWDPSAPLDRPQISCWKNHEAIELAANGGNDARLPWRRVFPVRFLLRRYPIRQGESFIRDAGELQRFDGEAARLHLWLNHATVDELRRELTTQQADDALLRAALDDKSREVSELNAELRRMRIQLDTTHAQVQELMRSRTWRWTSPARLAWRLVGKD